MENINWLGSSIDEVLASYKIYLKVKYPRHLEELEKREKSNIAGIQLEAAIFSMIRHYRLNPTIGEDISTGGVDFICNRDSDSFVLEVTHLDIDSVENQSGLSKNPVNGEAKSFSMITHILEKAAARKIPQVSNYPMPRIICIGSTHPGSTILLGSLGARWLLTGRDKISVPIGMANPKSQLITQLENSVFLKCDKEGNIIPRRKSISAILLVTLDANSCLVVGVLHPEPLYHFDIEYLPDVPFFKISNWPFSDNRIETEWVISRPSAKRFYLKLINFAESELKEV